MTALTLQRWGLLLRGVNVGGVTLRSADLRHRLAAAGFTAVRTVLASGNALVTSAGSEQEVAERAVAAISTDQGRRVPVLVRTQEQIRDLVACCPYDGDSEAHHAYVVLAGSEAEAGVLWELTTAALALGGNPGEEVSVGDRALYWRCPRGSSVDTAVSQAIERAARQVLTTTRNVRTLRRLTVD